MNPSHPPEPAVQPAAQATPEPIRYPRSERLLAAHPELNAATYRARILPIIMDNSSFKSKRQQFLRLADEFNQTITTYAICKPGCAHCCHMSTLIYAHEAEAMGQASGITPRALPYRDHATVLAQVRTFAGTPCPFLSPDSICTVYDHRPLVCRLHHSLGDDADACVVTGMRTRGPVPKVDPDMIELPYHGFIRQRMPREPWGTIQEFFPPG